MDGTAQKFLKLYKDYEQACRTVAGMDPKELEDSLPEATAGRLRMCRLFRNYLSHSNDPGFLEPTGKMYRFLEDQVLKLRLKGDVAKKHLKKPDRSIVRDGDKIQDALLRVLPLRRELVAGIHDGKIVVYRLYDMVQASLAGPKSARMSSVKPTSVRPGFARPDTPMEEIDPEGVTVCTDDGSRDGTILGVVVA